MCPARVNGFGGEHIAYRVLERGGNIRYRKFVAQSSLAIHIPGYGTLNAGEREIPTIALAVFGLRQGARKRDRAGIAVLRLPVYMRPAGIRQIQPPCD